MRILASLLLLVLAGSATAQIKVIPVRLNGDEPTPPIATSGVGRAEISVDTNTGEVRVQGDYDNMTSNVTDVHIHGSTRRGGSVGVFVGLIPTGGTTGTFSGGGILNAGQLKDLLDGLTYINVHTINHAAGEIRGHIDAVPDSGHPNASFVSVTGEAKPGGTLGITCPSSTGMNFIVVGIALPPCTTMPLLIPEMCMPGPANVAVDLGIAPIAFPGSDLKIPLPMPFPSIELAIQCATITPANCVTLSGAHRIAYGPELGTYGPSAQ